ncbi:protein-glutamate methylesterase/protein-glutamine glutaminase [Paenibacillus agricola]|uniref:Protein-glutamate methylesterase/protein-glutamine glutaminase n=1 Tax=Paenibacillus agricola TaxID=2716264 RepID=A0ABX0J9I5_9BACL|nr:chemotaxis response regulator protein-glutamate methylesterase [Paenibacillus agricola]NHN32807.1 chemotaxis response regulator protein-glutamate methylesterase [Paenibacillus agricola]
MKQYGVLIVDDSAFMRRAVSLLFEKDPAFYIVGIARNGIEAIEKLQRFKPDVITMDVEMPGMGGIEALELIMKEHPVPVVMLSSQTGEGTQATIQALQLGAIDFFLKESLIHESLDSLVLNDFLERMKIAATAKIANRSIQETVVDSPILREGHSLNPSYDLLVIGCSTGGPSALQTILPRFSPDFNASIIVIQHMPPGFTGPLAERFNNICQMRVREAQDGDLLQPGTIYIAPSGYQTLIRKWPDGSKTLKVTEEPVMLYKPSVNVTLESAAPIFEDKLLAVVLTGMGNDGLEGCRMVRKHQGRILVEAEESCIVYGMPKVIFEAGLADRQVALPRIYQHILSFM